MAFINSEDVAWHEGEEKMQSLLHVPYQDNPTSPFLTPGAAHMLQISPLLAIGVLDSSGRPWTTIWGGDPGFARSLGSSIIGVKISVDPAYDPVVKALLDGKAGREVVSNGSVGRLISGLAINLNTRKRVKIAGRMAAVAFNLAKSDSVLPSEKSTAGELQLVVKVEESLGNCPKYLNKKHIIASWPSPELLLDTLPLSNRAVSLLAKSDLFFVSSSNAEKTMGTNYRGGPPGFTRLIANDVLKVILVYPEYSGNRFYQTLGNLYTTPRAGFVFPDSETGDVLYITGDTEILIGKEAAGVLPHSNLAVMIHVFAARFVQRGLPFRGEAGEPSPYNPPIRYLASEQKLLRTVENSNSASTAKLLQKDLLAPSIARFRFSINDYAATTVPWEAGQHVALSLADELSLGYSHMRDSDPRSLNDDYTRSFTISSQPGDLPREQFEITIRDVGVVTGFMFRQNVRAGLEVGVVGFGGDFVIEQPQDGDTGDRRSVAFVAGGIGITPLLGQVGRLDLTWLHLFWTINLRDIGLVSDAFERHPRLPSSTSLFVSGEVGTERVGPLMEKVEASGARILKRRLRGDDLLEWERKEGSTKRWYICTVTGLRKSLLEWLGEREVLWEDFGY